MEHKSQYIEATLPTVKIKESVSCNIFDDKVRPIGQITVEKGRISITLGAGFHLANEKETMQFMVDSIGLGLERCFLARPDSFDPDS